MTPSKTTYNTETKAVSGWNVDNGFLYVMNNGYKQRMPRYYKNKIFKKGHLKRLNEEMIETLHEKYLQEINRLSDLGYENPEAEYDRRAYEEAKQVFHKAKKGTTL